MNNIDEKITKYWMKTNNTHSRYLSWEHCWTYFQSLKNKKTYSIDDFDKASLMLAFYLASWGMYRGSSFLLQKDYKVHENLIRNLLTKHKNLWAKKVEWKDLNEANTEIKNHYTNVCEVQPTDTLITKILLGMFGCTPAYDRFFKKGIGYIGNGLIQQYSQNSYEKLWDFYEQNKTSFKEKNLIKYDKYKYPPMKLIDMYFWQIGFEGSLTNFNETNGSLTNFNETNKVIQI